MKKLFLGLTAISFSSTIFAGSCAISPAPIYTPNAKAIYPSEVKNSFGNLAFPLSNFVLILPVNSYDCGLSNKTVVTGTTTNQDGTVTEAKKIYGAKFISSASLTGKYSYSPYFYLNQDNQLVFNTPANAATTSPGDYADHARTELREFYAPEAANDGNWMYSLGGTMKATVSVNSVSPRATVNYVGATETGGAAIVGQIHAAGASPFVVLAYRPESKSITVNVFKDTLEHGTGLVEQRTLATNVKLDEFFTYELSFLPADREFSKEGKEIAFVSVSINDATPVKIPVEETWQNTAVRFSLGAYHIAPNTGNADKDHTQVTFKSFEIIH